MQFNILRANFLQIWNLMLYLHGIHYYNYTDFYCPFIYVTLIYIHTEFKFKYNI